MGRLAGLRPGLFVSAEVEHATRDALADALLT